jgi:predicted transcriptional regulator
VTVGVSFRLDSKTAAELEAVAKAAGRTKPDIVVRALRQYLDESADSLASFPMRG